MIRRDRWWPVGLSAAVATGAAYVHGGWLRNLGPAPFEAPEWFLVPLVAAGGVAVMVWGVRRSSGVRPVARLRSGVLALAAWAVLLAVPYAARRVWLESEVRSLPLPADVARRVDVVRFDDVPDFKAEGTSLSSYLDVERTIRSSLADDGWSLLNPPTFFVGPRQPVLIAMESRMMRQPLVDRGRSHRYVFARGDERLIIKLYEQPARTRIVAAKPDGQPAWLARLLWRLR